MISHNLPTLSEEEVKAAAKVLRSKCLIQGNEVRKFEDEMCIFLGLPLEHAVAVSSGTAALFLSLWALDAKDKVISFPSYVCSSVRNSVSLINGKELVIDVECNSPNISISDLSIAKPALAIVPHMFGIPVDIQKISHIKIIEDCAQSLGAKIGGLYTGLIGEIGILSFYATKLITSGGQGGMIISRNIDNIEKIKDFREFDCRHDQNKRFNFQMTDMQASIGRVQLRKLPMFLERRERIFQKYKKSGLDLIDDLQSQPVRYRAVIKTNHPQKIIETLAKSKIKSIVPIEEWELLDPLPRSVEFSRTTVSLPIYPDLADKDVDKIISVLLK